MLRFRGPLGVVRGVEVQVEELHLQGPQQLGCWTFDFQTALSEDAGERSVQIVLDRPPTTRIAVWVPYWNELYFRVAQLVAVAEDSWSELCDGSTLIRLVMWPLGVGL